MPQNISEAYNLAAGARGAKLPANKTTGSFGQFPQQPRKNVGIAPGR